MTYSDIVCMYNYTVIGSHKLWTRSFAISKLPIIFFLNRSALSKLGSAAVIIYLLLY